MGIDKQINGVDISSCADICRYDECQENYCEIYRALKATQKDEYIKRLEKGYQNVIDIISPYLSDFDGINEDGYFDLALAIKELLENNRISQKSDLAVDKCVRWQPILGQYYFYVDDGGIIRCVEWHYDDADLFRYNTGRFRNCYISNNRFYAIFIIRNYTINSICCSKNTF